MRQHLLTEGLTASYDVDPKLFLKILVHHTSIQHLKGRYT